MLFHLVAFRFKPENKHSVGEAVARLRAMAPLIGEVLDLKVEEHQILPTSWMPGFRVF